jgi:trk system potassium uptake protein TrkA
MADQGKSWARRIWQSVRQLTSRKTSTEITQYFNGATDKPEFIVIGLGRFGTGLAMTLNAHKHSVLAIDLDMKRVQQVSQVLPHVIQLDATNIDALREVGAVSFDTGVVCIGTDFEANLLATFNLRRLGLRRVIAKAVSVTQHDILLKIGADEVILPEHEAGVRLGRRLAALDFVDFLELSEDKGVVEIVTPEWLVGQSLSEAQIRQRYSLSVVAIRRDGDVIISPQAEEVINEKDILVVLGRIEHCQKLREGSR